TWVATGSCPYRGRGVRDIDSTEVPTYLARYDLDAPTGGISEVGERNSLSLRTQW
ncbi:unnamed protein product, partial [Ectocarpus sp. 12 AP-2014]